MERKLLVIINLYSGLKQGKRYLADILELFSKAGYHIGVHTTLKGGDAKEYAKKYAGEYDTVVCIGGDGTFNECVSGILDGGHNTPIGYIPAGSTNDFASSIGLSKRILTAASDIVLGKPATFDTGRFNDRHFTYVASFGAFTKSSYQTPQNIKNVLGHLAYVLDGIKEIGNIRPQYIKMSIGDEKIRGDYIFGAVCNSTSLGGILTLDKNVVDMNDGLFEILLIKSPKNILELNECITALRTQNYSSKMLVFKSAEKVTVTECENTEWSLDGEYQPACKNAVIENMNNSIRIILPEK